MATNPFAVENLPSEKPERRGVWETIQSWFKRKPADERLATETISFLQEALQIPLRMWGSAWAPETDEPTMLQVPGWVSWTMRQLQRPSSSVFHTVLVGTEEIPEIFRSIRAGEGVPSESLWRLALAPAEGFLFDEPVSGQEVVRQLAPDLPPWAQSLIGFGADVVFDPLSYVGIGAPVRSGGRALLSVGGRPVIRGERILSGIDNLTGRARQTGVGRDLQRMFSTRIQDEYTLYRDDMINLLNYRIRKAQEEGLNFQQAVQKVSRETGFSPVDISQAIERASSFESLPGQVSRLAEDIKAWNQAAFERLQQAGIPTTPLQSAELEYLKHAITPEAKKILQRSTGKAPTNWTAEDVERFMVWDVRDPSGKSRTLRDMTVMEANEWFRKQHGVNLFIEDPAVATTIRVVQAEKAATSAEFLRGVTQNPEWAQRIAYTIQPGDTLSEIALREGMSIEELLRLNPQITDPNMIRAGDKLHLRNAPPGWKPVEGKRFGDITDDFAFHPDIADDLMGFIKIMDPDEMSTLLSLYDEYLHLWKVNALAWYPGYHLRNVFGNILNNYAAGVKDPRVYNHALQATFNRSGGNIKLPNPVELPDGRVVSTLTYSDLRDLAARHGARGQGQYGTLRAEDAINLQRTRPSDYAFMVQELQEDWTRMAHFLDRLLKGDSPVEAAQSVKKYLFDYSPHGLTEFERDVMSRIIPFYTWTRNNIPLQLEILFTKPGVALLRPKAAQAIETAFDTDASVPPEYMDNFLAGLMPIQIGVTPEGEPRYWGTRYWDPFADLQSIATGQEALSTLRSSVSPLIQAMDIMMTGQHPYFGWNIEDYPGQLTTIPGLPDIPIQERHLQPLLAVAPGSRALWELQRANPFNIIDPGDPRTGWERVAGILGLRTYSRDPEGARLGAQIEWQQRLTGLVRDYRRATGSRSKTAIRHQIQQHINAGSPTLRDVNFIVEDLRREMQRAFAEGNTEDAYYIQDLMYTILEKAQQ